MSGTRISIGVGLKYNRPTVFGKGGGSTPDIVPANYGLVSEHEGTKEDPIPYVHWIVIRKDKYYTENGILYIGLQDAPNGYDADLSTLSTLAKKVE